SLPTDSSPDGRCIAGLWHYISGTVAPALKSEVEGNRTQCPKSFDDNGFGDDSESTRAKTYAFEADSDSVGSLRQQALTDLQRAWKSLRRLEDLSDDPAEAKAAERALSFVDKAFGELDLRE
ncbi:MAG: hypothetical protein KDB01_15835, partial [Planctomycetaceae bacterium]|nr:hypothetical protein [Planctomycetaceae bacterium]